MIDDAQLKGAATATGRALSEMRLQFEAENAALELRIAALERLLGLNGPSASAPAGDSTPARH